MATKRRAEFGVLMRSDPARALELAVPETVRRMLPREVLVLLEKPVDARGDLEHFAGVAEEGQTAPADHYEARVNGKLLEAYVTAERSEQPSRYRVPIHGYQLDGGIVVRPTAGRLLEPVEVADVHAAAGGAVCPVSEEDTRSQGDEAGLAVGTTTDLFCSSAHAALELEQQTAAEQATRAQAEPVAAAGGDGGGAEVLAESSHTEGSKTILFIRVDFSDHTSPPVDGAVILPYIANAWSAWSYGRCTVNTTASATTPILRMPKVAGSTGYNGSSSTLYSDALAAATTAGYTPGNYSFVMVCMDNGTPGFTFAGLGTVGGNKTWLRAEGTTYAAQVATHELGHNLGLNHAQSYVVSGSNPIASGGTTSEYGDPYNTMGNGDVYSPYNARYKLYLNWLTGSDITTVTTSGIYRVAAHDKSTATGIRGLKVARTASQDYCLDYMTERSGTQATYNDNGVQVRWGPTGTGNGKTQILDMTSGSANGLTDAPLAVGRTFVDAPNKVYLTTLAKVTGASFDSMDVLVNLNTAPPPPPWTFGDIGTTGATGIATFADSTHLIYGAGADIWSTADAFHFVRQSLSGDCDVRARVTQQANSNGYAKAGVMLRDGTGAGAAHASMYVTPSNGFSFQYRSAASGATTNVNGPALNAAPNNWVRMTRVGNVLTGYVSANGTSWTQVATATLSMSATISGGLAVCSHIAGDLGVAAFDNVSVSDSAGSLATLANDGFDTASPTIGNDSGDALDLGWTGGGATLTLAADTTFGTGNALNMDATGTFSGISAPFDPRSLVNTGDSLKLSFDFRYTQTVANNSGGFRFGLFNDDGDGFGIQHGTGGATNYSVTEDTGADGGFNSGGTVGTLTAGSHTSLNDQLKHTATFTLLKTATGMMVTGTVDGATISATDTTPVITTFTTIFIRNGGINADLRVDNVKLDYTHNFAPVFSGNPLVKPSVFVGNAFSSSVSSDASDANPGDTLTFSKTSGPAWLTVAANGALTGTPAAGDTGVNSFVVRATDTVGAYAETTVAVNVAGALTNLYWDGTSTSWNSAANWSTASGATTPDPAVVPGTTNLAVFNMTGLTTVQAITLDANQSVGGITVATSGTTSLTGGGTNRTLTLDVGGITVNSGGGALTIGSAVSGQNVAITLAGSQAWSNSGAAMTINNNVTGSGLNWSNTGSVTFRAGAVLNLGTGTLTHNSGTLDLQNNANTIGNVFINGGTIFARNASALGATGTIKLGATGGSMGAILNFSTATITKPVALGTTTGTLVIGNFGFQSPTINSAITGTNNVTFNGTISTTAGISSYTMTLAGSVNPSGNVTFSNSGTGEDASGVDNGTIVVSGAIGGNVGNVTVNNSTSATTGVQKVVLSNAGNAWIGGTTVNTKGLLQLGVANAIPAGSSVTVNGTLDLNTYDEAIDGLSGSGTVDKTGAGISTLSVGGNDASTTFTGMIKNTAGSLALVKAGAGTLVLTGTHSYSGATTVSEGVLQLGNGGATGSVASTTIVDNGAVVFNRTGSLTVAAVISGTGSVTHAGTGATTLTGANTYAGGTTVSAGTLSLSSPFLADGAAVGIAGGATLNLSHSATDTIASLTLNGVLQAAGTWGALGSGADHETSLITGTGKLLATTGAPPYDAWAANHGLTGLDAGKTADPDGDGQPNLLEFALDGDPSSNGSQAKIFTGMNTVGGESVYTYTIAVRAGAAFLEQENRQVASVDGIDYTVEATVDVMDWDNSEPVSEIVPAITAGLPAPNAGWEYHTFRTTGGPDSAPAVFIRTRVVSP
ncbi:autotransporter-associated beta strand repeat-containing protein [Luteolibacter sp. LG18]|uniref:autotransporter-associated beta strand repeat-containing protein n=1 Tax=Luteolibacter sp. LG18 TaxID=2819286 RepID=UPI002B2E29B1|nr:hypothetical protein llg_38940 [Luteolibacter sp. LG18]